MAAVAAISFIAPPIGTDSTLAVINGIDEFFGGKTSAGENASDGWLSEKPEKETSKTKPERSETLEGGIKKGASETETAGLELLKTENGGQEGENSIVRQILLESELVQVIAREVTKAYEQVEGELELLGISGKDELEADEFGAAEQQEIGEVQTSQGETSESVKSETSEPSKEQTSQEEASSDVESGKSKPSSEQTSQKEASNNVESGKSEPSKEQTSQGEDSDDVESGKSKPSSEQTSQKEASNNVESGKSEPSKEQTNQGEDSDDVESGKAEPSKEQTNQGEDSDDAESGKEQDNNQEKESDQEETEQTSTVQGVKSAEELFYETLDLSSIPESLQVRYNSEFCMELSSEQQKVLETIVEAEAGDEDIFGKMLVAGVVLNRVLDEHFPDTVKEVVFQNNGKTYQFSPVRKGGRYYTVKVSSHTKDAVARVLKGEDYSDGALYFFARKYTSQKKASWFDTSLKKIVKYGCHEFYKEK